MKQLYPAYAEKSMNHSGSYHFTSTMHLAHQMSRAGYTGMQSGFSSSSGGFGGSSGGGGGFSGGGSGGGVR